MTQSSRSDCRRCIVFRTPKLLCLAVLASSAIGAESFIADVDSQAASKLDREQYKNDRVIRYRIVAINESELRSQFYAIASATADDKTPAVVFPLFDDVVLSTSSFDEVTGVHARFFLAPTDSDCKYPGLNAGYVQISQVGHVQARFDVCDRIYTISPTIELPYHLVSQLDPKKMGSID